MYIYICMLYYIILYVILYDIIYIFRHEYLLEGLMALLVWSKNHGGGDHPSRASQEPKEGEDPPLVPKSDADALELLRRKFRRGIGRENQQEPLK
jgi:hypothetical protein